MVGARYRTISAEIRVERTRRPSLTWRDPGVVERAGSIVFESRDDKQRRGACHLRLAQAAGPTSRAGNPELPGVGESPRLTPVLSARAAISRLRTRGQQRSPDRPGALLTPAIGAPLEPVQRGLYFG